MNIVIVSGAPLGGAHYLEEILRAMGICCTEIMPAQEALLKANPATDLLLLPAGSDATGIAPFILAGGNVVAIRPQESVAALAGLTPHAERDKPSRLRFVMPICPGARGEPLWTLGPATTYQSDSAGSVLAYLFVPGEPDSESIGIVQCPVGDGSLTVFAYDPATCIMRLRQGTPDRANYLPPGQTIPRSIHLHQPDAPQDTAWRPSADLHAAALCDVIKGLVARRAPMPTLWHIPAGRPALLIFSGDEDGSAQEDNDREMSDVESHGGSMSLYVIPDNTSITKQHIEDYTLRGHTISVHPNLVSTCGQSPEMQLAKAEEQVLLFKEKFGQPVHTLRNHCTMWPGYVEIPELWERLGIGMDANCFATRFQQSPDWGPYVNIDAAIPLRFVREDGSLIDVYQQPTHINDDVQFHATVDYSQKFTVEQWDWISRRVLEDATRFFHAPICANFHPCNYVKFADGQGQALMRGAREFDMPIWSLDRWHDFWRARATWRMSDHAWHQGRLSFTLTGSPCDQLWIMLPVAGDGSTLDALQFNDAPVAFETVERFQQSIAQAALPSGVQEVKVVANYR